MVRRQPVHSRRHAIKLLGASLLGSQLARVGVADAAPTLRLGAPKLPHYAACWAAADSGSMEMVEFKAGTEELSALLSGSIDIAALGYWHLVSLLDKGAKVQAVCGLCSGGSRLVVRQDLNPTSWADLRGKTVAVARGSIQDIQFLMALRKNGLSIKDINYRDLGGNLAVHLSALQQHQIDYSAMWEPFASVVIKQGVAKSFSTMYADSFSVNGLIVARDEVVKSNPEGVQKAVAALVASTNKLNADPSAFLDLAVKLTGFDRSVMQMANSNLTLDYRLLGAQTRQLATAGHEFSYAQTDVGPKLADALDYRFLSAATGKPASELGG